jgi:EAL domain-containing protein (putative c-di-GMP-specific phosphodiesterase class I)
MLPPDTFIPLLERNGKISEVDKYVWEHAARQIRSWREQYGVSLSVSVNLSRVDVFDPLLSETLDEILRFNGLDHNQLVLEVTESAYTENAEQLIRVISELREKGYEIEMDDFGSGYSSLNMLSSLPIDVLKMDIGFIQNIEHSERDFHLVELILDIARYLKVPVVAEGVETGSQLKLLKDAGCDLVQGYYFSRPLPAEEFERRFLGIKGENAGEDRPG